MTRIAIFCDGTWNSPTDQEPTHVHKLQRAVLNAPERGQVSVYFAGIGTDERFDGRLQRVLNRYGGGAFGWGLGTKVKQAYQFIARVYRPGDEIYLFGFSRGAYTARSVAGMIRKCGIVEDTSPDSINRAFRLYRKGGPANAPDMPHIREARRWMSPRFATSEADRAWRNDGSEIVQIAYIGVWDTVGARGVPAALPGVAGKVAGLWNRRYLFHDTQLSSLVKSARHAVAVNERRVLYPPSLWNNLEELNAGREDDPLRPYQQLWFVGNHSIIGGSARTQALTGYPLMWVLEGAGRLIRDPEAVLPLVPEDILTDAPELDERPRLLRRWRAGPRNPAQLHPSVRDRWSRRSDYRPANLRHLFPEI